MEDWTPAQRSLLVLGGKGRKDRVTCVIPTTARALREYLGNRRAVAAEDFLFADMQTRRLKRRHLIQTLHRLSAKVGLPPHRRLHPHALRHFVATSWLRNGVGIDEVRRLLGHESLSTMLRYSNLAGRNLQQAHRKAGAIERIKLLAGESFRSRNYLGKRGICFSGPLLIDILFGCITLLPFSEQ